MMLICVSKININDYFNINNSDIYMGIILIHLKLNAAENTLNSRVITALKSRSSHPYPAHSTLYKTTIFINHKHKSAHLNILLNNFPIASISRSYLTLSLFYILTRASDHLDSILREIKDSR